MNLAARFRRRWLAGAALLFLLASSLPAQVRIEDLRAQFNGESDPVRKAKALPPLGDALFELMGKQADADNDAAALRALEEYRNDVGNTVAGLKATHVDAEKKPAGFKQLQIHVRKSIRRLSERILVLPFDLRSPFETIRRELEQDDKELIDMLFPRQPGRHADRKPPKT